eukprot:COSAG02_NODE_21234_length_797_cov_0.969914_1_plen_265_part_11
MVDLPEEQQGYTLVHRDGTVGLNYTPDADGALTAHMNEYHPLPQLDDNALVKDQYTDTFSMKIHPETYRTLCPGRGQGLADTINLKMIGKVDPNDVNQGSVGDCWLLSAISSLAEFPGAIKHLFRNTEGLEDRPRHTPNSYTITLWDLERWEEVDIIVDERLCATDDGKRLRFAKLSEDGELWVCYLEKALAAHCGGWDEIDGGHCTHGWALLTGSKEQYSITKDSKTGMFECHSRFGNLLENHSIGNKATNGPHGCRRSWGTKW